MASRKINTENIDEDMLLSSIGKSRTVSAAPPSTAGVQPPTVNAAAEETKAPTTEEDKTKPTEKKSQNRTQQAKPQAVDSAEAYRETYLQKNDIRARHCAYISKEDYAYFAKVVRVVTDNEISVGGYIGNILREHRMAHKDALNELFRRVHEKGPFCD